MDTFKLVHLSDLHFSVGGSLATKHSHSVARLVGLQKALQDHDFDKLIVSGDLSDRGDQDGLLQAYEWLFADFAIGQRQRIGLRLDSNRVGMVPGNHDAYDAQGGGRQLDCWQRALDNFNTVFSAHNFTPPHSCRYDWIPKGDHALFVVYVDSCYLNDPEIESYPDIRRAAISSIRQVARGRLTKRQTNHILDLFDSGMRGTLPSQMGGDIAITSEKFARSLKILVMHHYLFEPPEHSSDFWLKLEDRNRVFRNLAMADFDLCLCGHKHVPDFQSKAYGEFFDTRAKARYCLNLFRRMIGIHTMPLQLEDPSGKRLSRWLSTLAQFLYIHARDAEKDGDGDAALENLIKTLQEALDNPAEFETKLRAFLDSFEKRGTLGLSDEEIRHIQIRLSSELSTAQRKRLGQIASRLNLHLKRLAARSFLQILCGSSAKECTVDERTRSFNTYTISATEGTYRIKAEQFTWGPGEGSFCEIPTQREHLFEQFQRVMFAEFDLGKPTSGTSP